MGFAIQYPLFSYPEKPSNINSKDNHKIFNEVSSDVSRIQLSDGEIHYLYWFIQGSIMVPNIRRRLRRAWGFCERHAWGYILVEAAFWQRRLEKKEYGVCRSGKGDSTNQRIP